MSRERSELDDDSLGTACRAALSNLLFEFKPPIPTSVEQFRGPLDAEIEEYAAKSREFFGLKGNERDPVAEAWLKKWCSVPTTTLNPDIGDDDVIDVQVVREVIK